MPKGGSTEKGKQKYSRENNEEKSAANFSRKVAAWVPGMFCNFYFVKNHEIAKNSTITKDREKDKHRFGILRILEKFSSIFPHNLKLKKNQILLNKISHGFLLKIIYWVKDPH